MRYTTISLAAVATFVATATGARAQTPGHLSGTVGVGAAVLPRYTGSDDYRVLPMPVVQLEYRERLYLGGSRSGVGGGLGAYLVRTPALTWQLELAGAESRPEGRGNALAGMGRRDAASYAATAVAYRLGTVTASMGFTTGLGNDAGSFSTIGVGTQRALARRWVGELSTGAVYGDRQNMAFEFGVTPAQSARRRALATAGDPRLAGVSTAAYAPAAGLKQMHASGSVAYLLTPRSRLVSFAQGARLSQEAARSPLVQTRNSVAAGMALAYTF